jgi:hypothetical protein
MAEDKGAAKEAAEGLRSVLERIGEFFHIFDLSFFVAGASTFAALVVLYLRMDTPRSFPFADWVGAVALVLACYICGLMAFTIGRYINGRLFRRRIIAKKFELALRQHEVTSPVIERYLTAEPKPRVWRLYIRMWQDLAATRSKTVAFSHLSRYWVMAATYDGLGASFIAWSLVSLLMIFPTVVATPLKRPIGLVAAALFALLATMSFKQAADFYESQIEDLVASLAASKSSVA